MQLGRQPDIRLKIETALVAYEKGEATPETKAMFRDWSVMVMATSIQRDRNRSTGPIRRKPLKWQTTGTPVRAAATTVARFELSPLAR